VFQSEAQLAAVVLWAAHTHIVDAFTTTPRLSVRSPEKASGKTRLLEVLELLVSAPLLVANISEAALFRLVAAEPVTLLHDEVDATFGPKARDHEDLRALLNAGHRRGMTVPRCVGEGSKMTVKRFPVFAPVALAGIGSLPDTLESRCIVIALKRRRPDERVEDFELDAAETDGRALGEAFAEWANTADDKLRAIRPQRVKGVRDRAWDKWRPLLAIAELAGGPWPERAREAAEKLTKADDGDERSRGLQLLGDVRSVWGKRGDLFTVELLDELNKLEESPWGGWRNGQGLDARGLARMLRPYEARPGDVHRGAEHVKGYQRADLEDAWTRYLPPDERSIRAVRADRYPTRDRGGSAIRAEGVERTVRKPCESLMPEGIARTARINPASGADGEAGPDESDTDDDGAWCSDDPGELG
jgi:hypothetical protein